MILHVKIAKVMILSYLLHCFLIFQVTHNENKLLAVAFFSVRQPARRQKKATDQQFYVRCFLYLSLLIIFNILSRLFWYSDCEITGLNKLILNPLVISFKVSCLIRL